jgi:hypothetical protein
MPSSRRQGQWRYNRNISAKYYKCEEALMAMAVDLSEDLIGGGRGQDSTATTSLNNPNSRGHSQAVLQHGVRVRVRVGAAWCS